MIPPDGFEASKDIKGFQNKKLKSTIVLSELHAPLERSLEGFTAESLKSKGMTLIDKQTFDLNNSQATLLKVSQPGNRTMQMLVFGDNRNSVLVMAGYSGENEKIGNAIKESLLSTRCKTDPGAIKYEIDVSGTVFKLAVNTKGSSVFTPGGQMGPGKPMLVVANAPEKVFTDNQRQYSIDRLKKLPGGESNKPKEINQIQIDNLQGYEIVGEGKNKNSLIYQVMLFEETGQCFIIVGMANEDLENNLKSFRDVARTFTRK